MSFRPFRALLFTRSIPQKKIAGPICKPYILPFLYYICLHETFVEDSEIYTDHIGRAGDLPAFLQSFFKPGEEWRNRTTQERDL
jgi:hypothetical protein